MKHFIAGLYFNIFQEQAENFQVIFHSQCEEQSKEVCLDLCSQLQGYLGIVHELNIQYHTIIESKKQSSSIIF